MRRIWHRVPRKPEAAPGSLEVSKARLGRAESNKWNVSTPWQC